MENPFYNDIYDILQPRGSKGLPVGIIAKQVYNRRVGLFNSELNYEKIYQNIRFYLWAQANRPSSPFTFGQARGWYALKPQLYEQIPLPFTDETDENEAIEKDKETPNPYEHGENELSLF